MDTPDAAFVRERNRNSQSANSGLARSVPTNPGTASAISEATASHRLTLLVFR